MEDEFLLPELHRVSGVVTAVVAGGHLDSAREPVDDLTFPLVAPLGPYDDDVRHFFLGETTA